MRIRASLTALTLLPIAAFTVAAGEAPACDVLDPGATAGSEDDVLACTSTLYLGGCDTETVGGKVHHQAVHSTSIPLVAEAPTTSFTAGGGCGTTDDPLFSGTRQDTAFSLDIRGYFTDVNPDSMTVELHDISASTLRTDGVTTFGVRVSIDGEFPLGSETNTSVDGTDSTSPLTVDVQLDAIASETGISDGLVFTVTNLSDALPAWVFEAGLGGDHDVIVTIDLPIDGAHALVWGATEVPASVTFNEPLGEDGKVRGTRVVARG